MKFIALLLTVLWSNIALSSFLPENDLWKEDSIYKAKSNIDEQTFYQITSAAQIIYTPIIEGMGKDFTVNADWNDSTVNAYASQRGSKWAISFFGGLARRPEVTPEGFALVVCHEIGHHLAGYPNYPDSPMSNEGNSDFFSTASCARKIFAKDSPLKLPFISELRAITACNRHATFDDREICKRSYVGGLSLAHLLANLGRQKLPKYETYSRKRVRVTRDSHPDAQCRLDTYYWGAMCKAKWDDSSIPETKDDFLNNSCPNRPACWFKI